MSGQSARLRDLVERYFADVWRFLRHLGVPEADVDDAAQEVFIVAARRLSEIQPDRERSFLFGTAFNVAQATRRKLAQTLSQTVVREDAGEDTIDAYPNPEQRLDDKQACALALRLLSELDEEQHQVFVLFEIEGWTMQRIADLTGVPLGTVASRLRRAREEFQTRFEFHRNSLRGSK